MCHSPVTKKCHVQLSDKCFAGLSRSFFSWYKPSLLGISHDIESPQSQEFRTPSISSQMFPFPSNFSLGHVFYILPHPSIKSFPKAIILLATLGFFAALLLLPELVASGLLAYSFGLRHAVDVDHIAPRKGPFSMGSHIYHMSYGQYSWLITIIITINRG